MSDFLRDKAAIVGIGATGILEEFRPFGTASCDRGDRGSAG